MSHRHNALRDYICPRCRMEVKSYIPHECDPSICVSCNGLGSIWVGRVQGVFIGQQPCKPCQGKGKTIWALGDGEMR
jgi:DnaJ-class molecular chaperone